MFRFLVYLLILWFTCLSKGFQPSLFHGQRFSSYRPRQGTICHGPPPLEAKVKVDTNDPRNRGRGANWVEKSKTRKPSHNQTVDQYDLGLSGKWFQTGQLGKKLFDAIVSKTSLAGKLDDETRRTLSIYVMDSTAKQATIVALNQSGLILAPPEGHEEEWGEIDSIRLYDFGSGYPLDTVYDRLEDAVRQWTPGQAFDFVIRNVPAKSRPPPTVEEIMDALDPNGTIRAEIKARKGEVVLPSEEMVMSIFDDDMNGSVLDVMRDCLYRSEVTSNIHSVPQDAFAGAGTSGYNVINRKDLLRKSAGEDGAENNKTLMHVMNSLVSHGVLLVDVTDGGKTVESARALSNMWKAADALLDNQQNQTIIDCISPSNMSSDSLKSLEIRVERATGSLIPKEISEYLGNEGASVIKSALDIISRIGKDVIRIAIAASNVEHGAFLEDTEKTKLSQEARAGRAAALLTRELVDDGKPLSHLTEVKHTDTPISSSSCFLQSYSNETNSNDKTNMDKMHQGHPEAAFVSVVPLSSISGLEVYNEEAAKWYRPELRAREHWKELQTKVAKATTKTNDDTDPIPWHARYVAVIPGIYLQLASRNEIAASIVRMGSVDIGKTRLSCQLLLRGRSNAIFNMDRYLGGSRGSAMLEEFEGETMESFHNMTQLHWYSDEAAGP